MNKQKQLDEIRKRVYGDGYVVGLYITITMAISVGILLLAIFAPICR